MSKSKIKKILNCVSRWFVGCVFLFSSFVKGVDPWGTAYKIEDYLTAWSIGGFGFEWAVPMAGVLSMVLIVLEFTVGVMLVCNGFKRMTAWVVAAMMAFFTIGTFVDAVTNLVSDCGCFGDAVKLTNWQTFWKNVVLDVFVVCILITTKWRKTKSLERDALMALFAIVVMVIFGVYNMRNEPCIDFRPWKVGNVMIDGADENGETKEVKSFLVYKNKATGEVKEFDTKEFMQYYNQKGFADEWEFVDSRVEDPYEIKADGFAMMDAEGEDYARDIIGMDDYVMIATIHHVEDVDADGVRALRMAKQFMQDNARELIILTSALEEDIQSFLYENELDDVSYYFADATAVKTILRSNPGFILLKDAKILDKCSYRNITKLISLELN